MNAAKIDEKLNELSFELEYWKGKKEEAAGDSHYAQANITLVQKQIEELNAKITN